MDEEQEDQRPDPGPVAPLLSENRQAARTMFLCNGGNGWHHFSGCVADPHNGPKNPKVRFHYSCRRCTAGMIREISYEEQHDGSIIPVETRYLLADGRTWTIPVSTYKCLKNRFDVD